MVYYIGIIMSKYFRTRKDVTIDMGLITKIFGTYSERELKAIYPIVDKIEALAEELCK